ncbi:hypothetical protein JTB14_035261 [Gonioctena quinquepunctata]|nr:hypothetical protein JTB14_035261 [Gonioctena quinquepunctata]
MELKQVMIISIILAIYLIIADAAIPRDKVHYDVHGNYLQPKEYQNKDSQSCCIIPTCDQVGQCFETISCGHVCSQGNYRPANYGQTPGYKLKDSYTKFECHFGECRDYKFLCSHCPDPSTPDFSVYTVRKDCSSCYY